APDSESPRSDPEMSDHFSGPPGGEAVDRKVDGRLHRHAVTRSVVPPHLPMYSASVTGSPHVTLRPTLIATHVSPSFADAPCQCGMLAGRTIGSLGPNSRMGCPLIW